MDCLVRLPELNRSERGAEFLGGKRRASGLVSSVRIEEVRAPFRLLLNWDLAVSRHL